ncbi:MAG: COX15/CtaA family protein [Acidiferrobacterales bacterium]
MHSGLLQQRNHHTQIAVWLLLCCALIFTMVVVGGVTRLTRSGLSMVEWDPIMGAIPPFGQSQWEETFHKYKQFPEYQQVNRDMTLSQFKFIYWMEYAHRLLGRAIGLAFLLPFLYFLFRRRIERSLIPKLVAMFLLGGLQGLLGWFMVKSGLIDMPRVSPYRLTAHLILAVVIYGYILWVALGLLFPDPENADLSARPLRRLAHATTVLIVVMIASGGFVAGTKAGFAFNTFPLMSGRLIPEGILAMRPVWTNFFENVATVQFDHRIIAYLLCLAVPWLWYRAAKAPLHARARLASHALLGMLVVQVSLGIATLLLVVPMALAAAHQAGAILLFTIALFVNHELRRGREPTLEWHTTTSPPWAG